MALEVNGREFADPAPARPIISPEYRNAGHSIYIGDFGTGYSSLSYLQNLDVDVAKIDKSFVDSWNIKRHAAYY
ncbi:EAL domain-containing protein [Salmonella enterica subsp. enterica]|nr:EAL domain-containing protein [Salmonella enterica subsp. enterica]